MATLEIDMNPGKLARVLYLQFMDIYRRERPGDTPSWEALDPREQKRWIEFARNVLRSIAI